MIPPHLQEGLDQLKKLAESNDAKSTLVAALIADPEGATMAIEINGLLLHHIKKGNSTSCAMVLAIAAIGHINGSILDVRTPGASQAVELFTETLVKVFRYATEGGFAQTMERVTNAADEGNRSGRPD